jgi:peptide/nickel transport system ATP-binding protein
MKPAQLRALLVRHQGRTLVDVPELDLEPGRPVTIVGESGSGKSLLAHAVMGTLPPDLEASGRFEFEGQRYEVADRSSRRPLWGRGMSLLPQEPVLALDPTMPVGEQVAEATARFTVDRPGARRAAGSLMGALRLAPWTAAFPHTLSGGMAQRVAFAAATIGGARVLLADEPSKGLDTRHRAELAALLHRHVASDGILLTITHDLDLARELGGTVVVMKDASIVEQGPASTVLTEPADSYTKRLLAAEPAQWTHPWTRSRRTPEPPGRALVSATGISKAYDGRSLFSGLDVTISEGERTVLTGPSGSGKTTLGQVLLRLAPADSGRVIHATDLAAGRLQRLYQDPATSFPPRVVLAQSLGDVLRRHGLAEARLTELMTTLRLGPDLLQRRPAQVSGGELQRLAIARGMLLEPTLIFADEPTSRLDLITQEETMGCLMEQVTRQGCALLLVTHDEALADAVGDTRLSLTARARPEPRGTAA